MRGVRSMCRLAGPNGLICITGAGRSMSGYVFTLDLRGARQPHVQARRHQRLDLHHRCRQERVRCILTLDLRGARQPHVQACRHQRLDLHHRFRQEHVRVCFYT